MLAKNAGLSDKLVSVRHHIASENMLTAGEASKLLSKAVNTKIGAKEIVAIYKSLHDRDPEWHHSGFYNHPGKGPGKKTMGRTFFFTHEHVEELAKRWEEVLTLKAKQVEELKRKANTQVKGFFFRWEKGERKYKGGPKAKIKILDVYEGLEIDAPRNFTPTSHEVYEKAKSAIGKIYTGWDTPQITEFQ